ncbi:MAG: type II toxin-antitoxin system RelE/ParE family toxin [Saprospiraceae bacterium]|nr:type II toxin-antitoxin system RelE/ParE family toxin [Saprospiraceae bacterium]
MKLTYKVSKLAQQDLEEIWSYTFENWSLSQADRYYRNMVREFDKICKNPELGRPIDYVKKGNRITRLKSHLIVYKILSGKIWIDRVLHESMDIGTRLGD